MRSPALAVAVVLAVAISGATGAVAGDDGSLQQIPGLPPSQQPVILTINPDGTAIWNGEPLANPPALENKLAHQAAQDPKLELDVKFHNVGGLSDSNRQTLLDILELTAKFGYVHVQATDGGARLTVLGPAAVQQAPK